MPEPLASKHLVTIGKVVGVHGVRGELKLLIYSGTAENIAVRKSILLKPAEGEARSFRLRSLKPYKKLFLAALKGVNNRAEALGLVNWEICLKPEELARLPEGEYYWHELVGLEVVTVAGRTLGRLEAILETGANDVYVARQDEREYLIPATHEVIKEIDVKGGRMVIEPLEGMLD